MTTGRGPLTGIRAVELGGGVGGAWCGRMLADLGATVLRVEPEGGNPLRYRREVPDAPETEGLLLAWLDQGKQALAADQIDAQVAESDLLIIGESAPERRIAAQSRCATIDLSWFGRSGPYAGWRGADIVAQALCGMSYPSGPVDGPPQQLGDLQSAIVGGVTALTAALAGLYAAGGHRRFEVSILESCMVLGELQAADAQMLGRAVPRVGINRFSPTCPISIHRCKEGWLGVTVITPAQWASFCELLERPDLAADPELATIYLRQHRAGKLEAIFDEKLRQRTAAEWAEYAREMRVPLVVVPDAGAILKHPVFSGRGSLVPLIENPGIVAPCSPLRVGAPGQPTDVAAAQRASASAKAPLAGLRIADFSMGWAGPLATRIMADLGAEVIKIEAGRYPDWWRGTQWSPEAIARKQFEESYRFAALNRGKKSVSFDLTTAEGADLARHLVAASDAVIENHAAGVIDRLGLGWDALREVRPELVMASMSAFGSGNAWSGTRAYGSTLEQASGMPCFRGAEGAPPVMGHIAYGDPIGGLYGAAATLAALVHRQRTGKGQWLNLSQVECLLPFTTPALLARGATGREPARLGNRHVAMAPHGIYPGAFEDSWIAIAVDSKSAWHALASTIGREDWSTGAFESVQARRARQHEIDEAITEWTRSRDTSEAAAVLQAAGVAAAPVLTPEEAMGNAHLAARGFFYDTRRPFIGDQRQAGLAMLVDGKRPAFRGTAPLLGGDTLDVLIYVLGHDEAKYEELIDSGVVSLEPTTLRGTGSPRD